MTLICITVDTCLYHTLTVPIDSSTTIGMFEKELKVLQTIIKNNPRSTELVMDILANLQKAKAVNDLRRIRKYISDKHKIIVPMEDIEKVYLEFQEVGWGKANIKRGQGAHSTFTWKIDYRAFGQLAIAEGIVNARNAATVKVDRFKVIPEAPRTPSRGGGETFVFKLTSTGNILRLNMDEILELDELIKAVK